MTCSAAAVVSSRYFSWFLCHLSVWFLPWDYLVYVVFAVVFQARVITSLCIFSRINLLWFSQIPLSFKRGNKWIEDTKTDQTISNEFLWCWKCLILEFQSQIMKVGLGKFFTYQLLTNFITMSVYDESLMEQESKTTG